MSYHLAMRSLQLSRRVSGIGNFADCIAHSLAGEHAAWELQREMQLADSHAVSLTSLGERLKELMAVDLNPVGHLMRLAGNNSTYVRTWDFYNNQGNVISKVNYGGHQVDSYDASRIINIQSSAAEKRTGFSSHEKILLGYHDALASNLKNNQNFLIRSSKIENSRVSSVARIYGMCSLVVELCEFFEEFPAAKVNNACLRLGIHPRVLERRMVQLGITAVKIKRACMLARATRHIIFGKQGMGEIAHECGYSHSAHLTHAVSNASGGMSPSLIRSLMHV